MQRFNWPLFLIGLFAETQIRLIGAIGISELYMFAVAPFVFIADYSKLKRDGFLAFIFCAFLAFVGCIVSSIYNHTPFAFFMRGIASPYSLFAICVVMHRYLEKDLGAFKWFLLGHALSGLITVLGFQTAVEIQELARLTDTGDSELYFVRHFGGIVAVLYKGWYMACPTVLSVTLVLIPILQLVFQTSTGRSAVMSAAFMVFMLLFVNRHVSRMKKLEKHIIVIVCLGFTLAVIMASLYKYAASKGLLNERSMAKYEVQTQTGTDIKSLIMSGRAHVFAGFMACCDHPIIGMGPWPIDDGNYWARFLSQYGSAKDYENFENRVRLRSQFGVSGMFVPSHSHIIGFWLWYGILGVPMWIYVLKKMFEYLTHYIHCVPQMFVVLACSSVDTVWTIIFSPYSGRVYMCFTITCLLLVISVGKGRIILPVRMAEEAIRKDEA